MHTIVSGFRYKAVFLAAVVALAASIFLSSAIYADNTTTSVTVKRMAVDGETANREITLTYQEMEDYFYVEGDGETHYYHQGPVYEDDKDARWNPEEDSNFKDYGAVKGTNIMDLCIFAGGLSEGQEIQIVSSDGWNMKFSYKNIYEYHDREGPMVLTWYKDDMYPDSGYEEGMRLVWLADDSVNPEGKHVFGNWDWHQASEEEYWYFYQQNPGSPEYPTTSGLSGKCISEIRLLTSEEPFWDIDGDRECGPDDISALGLKWGDEGEEGWIAEDANMDGVVNVLDAVRIGMYWGKDY
ncbi:MAG: hypothetical protein JXA46_18600 [Dehalococcoidales bacterium]|nr:hypothetical protein [Dehalococcoidales bacterium]